MPPPSIRSSVQMNNQTIPSTHSSSQSQRPPGSSSSRPVHHSTSAPLAREGKKSDLLCRVKWNNSLPDIPFDPKFIMYPFDPDRFKKYKPTSLEKEYKNDLLTEHDLGVNIDLISPETYGIPADNNGLSPEDEKLMEEDSGVSGDGGIKQNSMINEKRSRQHNLVVPWLKKTEYISTDFNRYGASSENNETKVGYYVQKKFKEDKEKIICMDKEGQIVAINKTFEEAKKPIKQHHSKKGVFPVEICPLLPDFEYWKLPFAQVSFDAEPIATDGKATKEQDKLMCEAMIRGVMDQESGEQFVAYFLPTAETLQKRKEDAAIGIDYDPDQEYIYQQTREYTWSVKNKSTRGYDQNYFFVKRGEEFYYSELETRVKLTKRRTKTGSGQAKLIVRHRALSDQELKIATIRESALKPQIEERDDEDEDEEEKEGENRESGDEKSASKRVKEEANKSSESEGEKSPKVASKREKRKRSADSASASDDGSSSSDSGSGSGSSGSSSSSESDSGSETEKKKHKSGKSSKSTSKPVYSSDSE